MSFDSDSDSDHYIKPHDNEHFSNPDINKVRDAIDKGDLVYLRENKDMIKEMYEKNEWNQSHCWCGCPDNYSLLSKLTHPPAHHWFVEPEASQTSTTTLEEIQTLYERSIRYLLDEGIIDPNRIFSYKDRGDIKKETILSELLEDYAGWEFQRRMILMFLHKTSSETIRNFRDKGQATMLQKFLMSHAYDDGTPIGDSDDQGNQFCIEVRDYLIAAGVDLSNIAHYPQYSENLPFSTLSKAVENLSPYLVKQCLLKKADPNLIVANREFDCLENMAMRMLFRHRYTHLPEVITDITQILSLLIQSGLNLEYLNADQRNISDYCQQNGFGGTSVEQLLTTVGAPPPTGKTYGGKHYRRKDRKIHDDDEDPDI